MAGLGLLGPLEAWRVRVHVMPPGGVAGSESMSQFPGGVASLGMHPWSPGDVVDFGGRIRAPLGCGGFGCVFLVPWRHRGFQGIVLGALEVVCVQGACPRFPEGVVYSAGVSSVPWRCGRFGEVWQVWEASRHYRGGVAGWEGVSSVPWSMAGFGVY